MIFLISTTIPQNLIHLQPFFFLVIAAGMNNLAKKTHLVWLPVLLPLVLLPSLYYLLNTIGNVNDFPDDKKLAAYFGIVPRVNVSNQTSQYGRITKMGNKIARTALVQSTLIAIRYNHYLRNFYLKLTAKKGSGKAIIAAARKLLTIIYRTLKYNNWVFEDFSQFKLAVNH